MKKNEEILDGIQMDDTPVEVVKTTKKKTKFNMSKKKIIKIIIVVVIALAIAAAVFGAKIAYDKGLIGNKGVGTFDVTTGNDNTEVKKNIIDKIVATFKDNSRTQSISKAQYETYYKLYKEQYASYGYTTEQIQKDLLERIALDNLLLIKAKDSGITLLDADKKDIDTKMSDTSLTSSLPQGIDMVVIRQILESGTYINKYIEQEKGKITDDQALENAKANNAEFDIASLKTYVTRHILFKTLDASNAEVSDDVKAAQLEKAKVAIVRLNNGEDFATLATELSEDTGTKANGGLFEFAASGNTVAEYKTAAMALTAGTYTSEPVKSQYGYHIIKLESINDMGGMDALKGDKVNADIYALIPSLKIKPNAEIIAGVSK